MQTITLDVYSKLSPELKTKLRKAARDAVQVQDACNLSGITHSFVSIITDVLRPVADEIGITMHTHPITRLFVDKLASLAGVQDLGNRNVMNAYDDVRALIAGLESADA
jgi:ABC-type branched-subunit amino acid transport system substrate-binding protein